MVILNTLVLPIISFQCMMLPVPAVTFKKIHAIITHFLWKGKRPKISRSCLEQRTALGGLGLHNIRSRVKAAKIAWLKRLADSPSQPWHFHLEFKMDRSGCELAQKRSQELRKLKRVSPFFAEIYQYWSEIHRREPVTENSIRNEWLWGNKFLRGRVKKKYENFCRNKGANRINDLLIYGKLMSDLQFERKYGCKPLPGMMLHFSAIIPPTWLQSLSPSDFNIQLKSLFLQNERGEWVDLHSLSAKQVYGIFENTKPKIYSNRDRWMKAYEGDLAFSSPEKWKEWSLLPYRITHEVQLQSFAFKIM